MASTSYPNPEPRSPTITVDSRAGLLELGEVLDLPELLLRRRRVAASPVRPRAYLAWEARRRAARRVLEQRGYDVSTAAAWSADGMTDRAQRYLSELEHDRWALTGHFGQEGA